MSTEENNSQLAGAWELVSDTQNGIAVFTDTYFNITITAKDRQPFKADEPTDAEAAEAYRTLSTAAGTYEISGTTLILHRKVNRNPSWTGKDAYWEVSIDGDRLTADKLVWKRVG
jgi:hypothetical protein